MSESVDYGAELNVYEAGDTTVNLPEDSCYADSNIELETDLNLASYGACQRNEKWNKVVSL